MLGRYAKAGVLVVAFVVLAAEAYLIYKHYDRYYSSSTASGVTVPEEAGRGPTGLLDGDGPSAFEDAVSRTTSGAETAGSDTPGSEESFVHRASDDSSRGDYTYLTNPSIDGDPNALVLVAPYPDDGNAGAAYDHNIGVWYEFVDQKKWAIFNQDLAAVPTGAAFKVVLPQAAEGFVHRAKPTNTVGDTSYLDDPLTNGEPNAVVSVAQNWNPAGKTEGVYNDHPVAVRYDDDADEWTIYNKDGAPIPDGAAFNVAVSEDAGSAR